MVHGGDGLHPSVMTCLLRASSLWQVYLHVPWLYLIQRDDGKKAPCLYARDSVSVGEPPQLPRLLQIYQFELRAMVRGSNRKYDLRRSHNRFSTGNHSHQNL